MKFLFASAHNLDDQSSGAAMSVHTLLKGLVREGHQAIALGGTIFDTPGAAGKPDGPWRKLRPLQTGSYPRDGVKYYVVAGSHHHRHQMTAVEEERLDITYRSLLDQERPDVVLTYGGMVLERGFLSEARARGIRTGFYLANPSYPYRFIFNNVDVILTDSEETRRLYRERLGLDLRVIGKLVDTSDFVATDRTPEFITFVNPAYEKGVGMVARLAMMCRDRLPDARFLVVESRGHWLPSLQGLGLGAETLPNVTVWPHQQDMRQVYGRTRLTLLPSFWHESGGRVAFESMLNGIPVVAECHGGAKEYLGKAGVLLSIPDRLRQKHDQLATEEEAMPWFKAIRRLWTEPADYARICRQTRREADKYALSDRIHNIVSLFQTLK